MKDTLFSTMKALLFMALLCSGTGLKSQTAYEKLYWSGYNPGYIESIDINGTGRTMINATGHTLFALEVDVPNNKMYWYDLDTDCIMRSDLNGSNVTVFLSGIVDAQGISIDFKNNKLFWGSTSSHSIESIKLDGTGRTTVVSSAFAGQPASIKVDVTHQKVYWWDASTISMKRANTDGTNQEVFIDQTGSNVLQIDIDEVNSKMYFPLAGPGSIDRINLDGTGRTTIVASDFGTVGSPVSIAVDKVNGKIYWWDTEMSRIQRADINGSNVQNFVPNVYSVAAMIIPVKREEFSKVVAAQCGATLTSLGSGINAEPVTGAAQYRFRVTNGANVQTIDKPTPLFAMTQLPSYAYNTTYTVEVAVDYGSGFAAYGDPCNVTTPYATSQLQASQCGAAVAASVNLYAANVTGATQYRFRVTNGANVQTIDKAVRYFKMTELASYAYGTTYVVEVAVNMGSGFGPYGNACNVTVPNLSTQIQASQCGATIATVNTPIYADGVAGVTQYRFRITEGANVQIKDNATRILYLTSLASYTFAKTYAIDVAVFANGSWSPYGPVCNVTTPSAITKVQASQCGVILAAVNTNIYADNVSGGTHYRFRITNGANVQTIDKVSRFFNLTELASYAYATTYAIDVAAEVNGVYGPYGTVCSVTTPSTKVQASQCGATLASLSTAIYADAVTGATQYRFRVTEGANVEIKDNATRILYLTTLASYAYATTYSIDVAVMVNGVWSSYGPACNVSTPSAMSKVQASQCGTTVATPSTNIYADNVPGAAQYRFRVSDGVTTQTLDKAIRFFNVTELGTYAYSTTYTIDVAVDMGSGFGAYGTTCTVSTPVPSTKVQSNQCGTTLASLSTAVYADLVAGGTQYRFRVSDGTTVQVKDNATRILYLTSLASYDYAVTYTIDVAVMVNGNWSAYGAACNVTTPFAMTRLQTANCDSVVSRTATIYANNLAGATQYRFRFTETANPSNVVTADRAVRYIALGSLGLSLTQYSVDVAVFYGGAWQPYGPVCGLSPTAPRPEGPEPATGTETKKTIDAGAVAFDAVTFPNPFSNTFGVSVTTASDEMISVTVYDMSGKTMVSQMVSSDELSTLSMGEGYAAGIYQVKVIQGTETKTLKVVKQ